MKSQAATIDAAAIRETAARSRVHALRLKAEAGTLSAVEHRELLALLEAPSSEEAAAKKYAGSLDALAAALGTCPATARVWLKEGAPAKTPAGYDVAAILEWRANRPERRRGRPRKGTAPNGGEQLDLDPQTLDGRRRWELARAKLAELELAERNGELVSREDVIREEMARALALKARLYELVRSMPRKLEGATAREIERLLRESVDAMLREFSRA